MIRLRKRQRVGVPEMRAAVGRLCNADVRAMHPGHAVPLGKIGAPVGVEHPPGLARAVPHNHGVRRTIVDGIAEERNGSNSLGEGDFCGRRRRGLGGGSGSKSGEESGKGESVEQAAQSGSQECLR